ncbi:Berardinelli-Seip congenital lipodystrophy 2 (seipin) [Thoreauomyces humboldtii]|nr:Berardinelli-Seip congenital lipodystrophy 2 (seipin) [Thoreauomyces humboldtii]
MIREVRPMAVPQQEAEHETNNLFFSKKLSFYVVNPLRTAAKPYMRLGYEGLTSTKTQRVALNTAIFGGVFAALLSFSAAIYALFYSIYIPRVTWEIPVYMQYGPPGAVLPPAAYVDFTGGRARQQSAYLTPEQHYDLALELVVPDSQRNFDLGNFMVHIDLRTRDNKTTASSSRPASLEYRTPLLRTMLTLWKAVPLLLGMTSESQTVKLLLLEKYEELQSAPIHHALITLSDARLQLYQTNLHIEANFQGLRYFMFHWKFTTGAMFVAVFLFWATLTAFMAWRLLVSLFKAREGAAGTESGSSASSTNERPSRNGSAEENADDVKASQDFLLDQSPHSDDADVFANHQESASASHLLASPHSMSSAPSYHSAPPFGSPPHYASHTSPPPAFDQQLSMPAGSSSTSSSFYPPLRTNSGSAYSYSFPYSASAANASSGMLPFTGYATVSALRAAATGTSYGSSLRTASSPLPSESTIPPAVHVAVAYAEDPGKKPPHEAYHDYYGTTRSHSPFLARDDTSVTLDPSSSPIGSAADVFASNESRVTHSSTGAGASDRSSGDPQENGLRLRRRSTLGDALAVQEAAGRSPQQSTSRPVESLNEEGAQGQEPGWVIASVTETVRTTTSTATTVHAGSVAETDEVIAEAADHPSTIEVLSEEPLPEDRQELAQDDRSDHDEEFALVSEPSTPRVSEDLD